MWNPVCYAFLDTITDSSSNAKASFLNYLSDTFSFSIENSIFSNFGFSKLIWCSGFGCFTTKYWSSLPNRTL